MNWSRFFSALLISLAIFANELSAAEPVRLTTDGRLKTDLVFLPGGTELAFSVQDEPILFKLMKLSLATGAVEPLHADAQKNEFELAISRDGRYRAFVQSRGNLSLALVIRDTQENKDAEVPPAGGFAGMRSPTFTPDGGRVLFSFPEESRQTIFSVNLQGGDRQELTRGPGINNWPEFNPAGNRIVFSSTRDGDYEIYTMAPDGSDVQRLTKSPRQDIRPRYSPDGKRIAFTSARDGNYEIYLMRADGSHVQRLTNHPERDDYPAWHPDGRRIAILSERDGQPDIYLHVVPPEAP